MHAPAAGPRDFLQEQNQREQPPIAGAPFATHLRSNSLLGYAISAMQANPQLDPATVVVATWNLVALDMTSIDHTTSGDKTSFPGHPAPVPVFEPTYGEQFGPPRSSRALAIIHQAMFEAANTVDHRFTSWMPAGAASDIRSGIVAGTGGEPAASQASLAAAVHEAAYQALVSLYPRKRELLNAAKTEIGILVNAQKPSLGGGSAASPEERLSKGSQIGAAAAVAVLLARATDGSETPAPSNRCLKTNALQPDSTVLPDRLCREAFFGSASNPPASPFDWTYDPISRGPLRLGENWGNVVPWVLSPHQFVTDKGLLLKAGLKPTPTSSSADFLHSLNDPSYGTMVADPHTPGEQWSTKYGVKFYGGFTITLPSGDRKLSPDGEPREPTMSKRTGDQTRFGRFWGYDATALLCAPPRLYNMVATSYWHQKMGGTASGQHSAVGFARYLALVNLSLAEAGIAAWDAKFKYHIARPITYIQDLGKATGGDKSLATWTPLGQAGSNGAPDGVTPAFPSYPSGHAVFGGAVFEMIANVTGKPKDDPETAFSFVSDEFNGHTFGADGKLRGYMEVHYPSLGFAEWENAESRIWLGIHWQMDADDGSDLGESIADAVYKKTMQPLASD